MRLSAAAISFLLSGAIGESSAEASTDRNDAGISATFIAARDEDTKFGFEHLDDVAGVSEKESVHDLDIPAVVTIKAINPDKNREGHPTNHGEMTFSELGPDFSKVPEIRFVGLSFGDSGNEIAFKARPTEAIPRPLFFTDMDIPDLPGVSATKIEPAQSWYGEQDGEVEGVATLIADSRGHIFGTINDGDFAYEIKTVSDDSSSESRKVTYKIHLMNIPRMKEEHEIYDNADVRRQMAQLRGRHMLSAARDLQEKKDIQGSFGDWYDSDGPNFSCDWYSKENRCGQYGDDYENHGFTANQACTACGGGGITIADVMAIYTPEAKEGAGGQNEIKNLISMSLFQTNIALSNTGIPLRHRLVHIMEDPTFNDVPGIDYGEFLFAVTNTTTDEYSHVHAKRENVGADLVAILGEDVTAGMSTSLGEITVVGMKGFAEVRRDQAALSGHYMLAHEFGHLMGARHEVGQDDAPGFAHGYIDKRECFRTIMSYPGDCDNERSHNSILQYSNIEKKHNGNAVGNEEDSNNARAINAYYPSLAELMPTKPQAVELCTGQYHCTHGSYLATHLTGDYPSMPREIANKELSLVNIPRGLSFEHFSEADFKGSHHVVGSSDYGITLDLSNQSGIAVNSFKIRQIDSGKEAKP